MTPKQHRKRAIELAREIQSIHAISRKYWAEGRGELGDLYEREARDKQEIFDQHLNAWQEGKALTS